MKNAGKIVCALAVCSALGGCATRERPERPNVIFILADDLGYGDLSVLNPDGKIHTPVLDSLAGQGMLFRNAHSSAAVSTPTRYGLMTGNYPWRGPMKQGVLWTWADPLLGDELTLPQMLRQQGYRTGLVGKWHLGIKFATRDGLPVDKAGNGANVDYTQPILDGPTHHGFDYYYGDDVPNFPPYAFIENDRFTEVPDKPFPESGMPGVPGIMAGSWRAEELLRIESQKSAEFIRTHKGEPFFLMVALTAPHTPIAPAREFQDKSGAGRYGDFVQEMDHRVGEILKAVKDAGIEERTIVIFSSDNGSSFQDGGSDNGEKYGGSFGSILKYGHNPSGDFRGMKSDAWEGGHRIPFIVKWPGRAAAGGISDDPVCDLDIFATLAGITGYELPPGAARDSKSLLPLLDGKEGLRKDLVTQSGNGVLSYLKGRWKLVTCSGSGGSLNPFAAAGEPPVYDSTANLWRNVQLYDMTSDPAETIDLSARHPDTVKKMMAALAREVTRDGDTKLWKQVEWIARTAAVSGAVRDTAMIKLLCPEGKDIFTGGDGAISVVVDKDKSLWIWGDSFMGEVTDNRRGDSISTPLIYGQLFVELDGTKARTICGGTAQHPEAVVRSDSVDGKQAVYWPHHGFVKNNILHTYMVQIVFDPVLWFYPKTVSYMRFRLPDYTLIGKRDIASYPVNGIWYGFGFFAHNGYYYTYGGTESRELHIARGKLIGDELQQWEYFDGAEWTADASGTRKLEGVDIKISTQFSVFPHGNKYILLTQDGESLSDDIYSYIADSPTGPWYNKKLLYTVPETLERDDVYSYNAMAHPQYDADGMLLVSYCINAKHGRNLWKDASIYRPRFIRVPYTYILN